MASALSKRIRTSIVASILLGGTAAADAQSEFDPIINEFREQVLKTLSPDLLGAGYASLINFAINTDISAATYYIDTDAETTEDPKLNVFRLPLRHVFEPDGGGWRPFVEANFAYQTYKFAFDLLEEEGVATKYRAYGGSLAMGAELPLSENLTLVPSINAGLARLENDADYHGQIANAIVKPALEGLVFDWDADAWLAGASLGIDYRRTLRRVELTVHGSLTHNYIQTFHSSSDFIGFDSQATTLSLNAETVHPTPWSIGDFPLAWVAQLGNTTFLGDDRDALGFEYFFEAGLALEAELAQKEWSVRKLRLGAKAVYGEDVTGWTLIIGYRF